MPLQKILFKPGVNRENTRYTTEGGWYDCDKVRFRQGTPEKIGGWQSISNNSYEGVCRSLWAWSTLSGTSLVGVGTNLKFYIEQGFKYFDVTPIRAYAALSGPFAATSGSAVITVTDTAHGSKTDDFVDISGAVALSTQTYTANTGTEFITFTTALAANTPVNLFTTGTFPGGLTGNFTYYVVNQVGATCQLANVPGGSPVNITTAGTGTQTLCVANGITATVLNGSHQITKVDANTYTFVASTTANAYDTGTGGTTVHAAYEIDAGPEITVPLAGWGAGPWGSGAWGSGTASTDALRIWNQSNWGQDLVYGPVGGAIYYWNASIGAAPRAITITIANPGVATFVSTSPGSLIDGTAVVLDSTGSLPTGLSVGTTYYVVSATSSTFSLAATVGGSAINTSGTQSGTHTISPRGIPISALAGAGSDYPLIQNFMMVSDASRFLMVFGTNDTLSTTFDPMLIRWGDQESLIDWTPSITNQAGSVRLSHGSAIITALQVRQEIIVWTDTALYSLQYLGPPYVWGTQLLGDNLSVVSPHAASLASGVVYWMGIDKFYRYDGRVQTLRCDLRQYIFDDINIAQYEQVCSGTNEGFNEVWWFYCSANSTVIDKYVVYNYAEDIWYYGTMGRTAWLDSAIENYPIAATYYNNLVYHEYGLNDTASGTAAAIDAYISSAEFDIGDGHNFGFVWRLIPDITFRGSTAATPQVTMSLLPSQNSGSGYNTPLSEGGSNSAAVVRGATVPIEQFTGQVYIRVRGRQMAFKVASTQLNTQWQLGAPRIDIKPDGRR